MLRNFCKIAWRNLRGNHTFSAINLLGLSLSVAFCLLLFFYIRHEQSIDSFHQKKDRLFRVEMTNIWPSKRAKPQGHVLSFLSKGDDADNTIVFPLVVGPDLQRAFPEVQSFIRFQQQGGELIKVNKEIYKEKNILYADSSFFTEFSFPLKRGNINTALRSPDKVVISESTARKYFGDGEVIGKPIAFTSDTTRLFTVGAVAADAPLQSSIQYTIIVPLSADPDYAENIRQHFNQSSHMLVIELAPGITADEFEKKLNPWVKKYYADPLAADYGKYYKDVDFSKFRWYLRPFADCHYSVSQPWGHYTNAKSLYELTCLAIVILLIASLNYVLLVISNGAERSQEVGMRKILGAGRRGIVAQLWVETQLLVALSVLTGFLLSRLLLPLFNNMLGTDIVFSDLSWKEVVPALLLLCVALGIIAGYYPALLLSKIKPLSIVKSHRTFRIDPRFSRAMVALQFTACVVLMIAAFVINRQMNYINHKDLGFDKEQVLIVNNPSWDSEFTRRVRAGLFDFARTQPNILRLSGMNGGLDGSYNTNGFRLNGEQKFRKQLTVDYDYFEMLDLKFAAGRSFSREYLSDTSKKMRASVVNETLFRMLGESAKIGEFNEPLHARIIGVVKDYHFETLSRKIEPEEHVLALKYESNFMFKIKAGQMQAAIPAIQKEWKRITNGYPFDYTFLDQTLSKMYEADRNWQHIIQASCFFAIFIACMGLFGLSAVNVINRNKEIGIRKVLGAGFGDIYATLTSGFLWVVLVSIVCATPIAWWIMSGWLEDFAYRIRLSWWMFGLVGLLSVLIALTAVSFQVIRGALANPIRALRTE